MFLAHLIEKYPEYKEFAKNSGGYKILDNSLIELGEAVELDRVVKAAEEISADEIILPDSFLNKNETLKKVIESLEWLHAYEKAGGKKFKKMAVVHGENERDWFKCFQLINTIDYIDVIGIPKVTHKLHSKGRPYFVNKILDKTNKEIHLLGIWCDFTELEYIRYPKRIRSVDSSLVPLYIKNKRDLEYIRPDEEIIDLENDTLPDCYLINGVSTDIILSAVSSYVSSL